jgi:peroxiredoxin
MKQYLSILVFTTGCITTLHAQITTISGEIDNLKNDTIKIFLQINDITRQSEVHTIPVKNGKFTDTLQINKPVYFYTKQDTNYVNGLLQPGDRITILYDASIGKPSSRFKGTGSEKTSFINFFLSGLKLYKSLMVQVPNARTQKYPFDYLLNYVDSTGQVMLAKLDAIKSFMNPESYDLLKADIKATVMSSKYSSVGLVYHESVDETLNKRQNKLTKISREYLQQILSFDETFSYSFSYLNAVYNILFVDYSSKTLDNKNLIDKYHYLSKKLPGKLKVPVLTLFLEYDVGKLNQAEDLETLINQIYSSPKDSVYRSYAEKRYNDVTSFKKGMNAPDFTVENEKGEKVTLASFKGKVVYIDFWYGACVPCHALFQRIEPVKKYFSSNDKVVFLTVSIDRKATWEAAIKKYKIPGYHVFTENKELSHPIIKSYKVASYPTTCLIDKNGKIFMATPSDNPEELQKEIEQALTIESN